MVGLERKEREISLINAPAAVPQMITKQGFKRDPVGYLPDGKKIIAHCLLSRIKPNP